MKVAIILANLGSPEKPETKSVNKYLTEFLTDPRVIDTNKFIWQPLLKFVILPKRSPKVAKLYQKIWTDNGSPLLDITNKQISGIKEILTQKYPHIEFIFKVAMSYAQPNIDLVTKKILAQDVDKIIMLPTYPQYSSTTTMPLFDAFYKNIKEIRNVPEFHLIHNYHNNDDYITALANSITNFTKSTANDFFTQEKALLISYHGLPLRYVEELKDTYLKQCLKTSELLIEKLNIKGTNVFTTFQSRFGKEPWLEPYTDETLVKLAQENIKELFVLCPGFSCDCLETLEEIAIEGKEEFLEAGGEKYNYIPALNSSPEHVQVLTNILEKYIKL